MSDPTNFMNSEPKINLTIAKTYHDRILIVGDNKFFVVSGILSLHSGYFEGLFNRDSSARNQNVIEIKDVDPEAMEVFLYILYEKSNDILIKAELVVPLMDISHHFLAPKVLQVCKDYILRNFEALKNVKMDILGRACTYDIAELKHLSCPQVIIKLALPEIYDCILNNNIVELKFWLDRNLKEFLSPSNCDKLLEVADKNNSMSLRAEIAAVMSTWNHSVIAENDITRLVDCAFKHDIVQLKKLLRRRIFYTSATTNLKNESGAKTTINLFQKINLRALHALPIEQFVFVMESANSPYMDGSVYLF